ncbi:MAG: AAA family ATPase [Planctomycetia bacterium]|nr:AAA family ATPase [Planctomycetia bacterium]
MRLESPRFDPTVETAGSTGFTFPKPVPISHLAGTAGAKVEWVWEGYLPRGGIVLFIGMWKAGKTTFLSHLFQAISRDDDQFCGLGLKPTKVLIVTQEQDALWNVRQEKLGLTDRIHFQRGHDDYPQPLRQTPSRPEWAAWTNHLGQCVEVLQPRPHSWVTDPVEFATERRFPSQHAWAGLFGGLLE